MTGFSGVKNSVAFLAKIKKKKQKTGHMFQPILFSFISFKANVSAWVSWELVYNFFASIWISNWLLSYQLTHDLCVG